VPFRSDYAGLLSDRRFANRLTLRTMYANRVRVQHRQVQSAIDNLLALIERQGR
jgi:hypothetical protein